jgi:hypothetical protein
MPNNIASKHPIPSMFSYIGVEKISAKDKFSIEYAEGFLTATINRYNGGVEVVRRHMNGGFAEATSYDPKKWTRKRVMQWSSSLKLMDFHSQK